MLMTLAHTFMTATRMDGMAHMAHAGASTIVHPRTAGPSLAARAFAALRRLVG